MRTHPGGFVVESERDDVVFLRASSARDLACSEEGLDWRAELAAPLHEMRGVGIVGAKRLDKAGRISSMGEMIIHPKGFHSVWAKLPGDAHQFAIEVDAMCSGAIAINKNLLEELGGADAFASPSDALVSSVQARRDGWRILTSPRVRCVDEVKVELTSDETRAFNVRFGFDWRAADLDEVRERHAGTGLLWNARYFVSGVVRYSKYKSRPMLHWNSYVNHAEYRARADALVEFITSHLPAHGHILDFGCGDGLFTHLFALRELEMTGIDLETLGIEQATTVTARKQYAGPPPRFFHADDCPEHSGDFDGVVMLDVIEHLPNPSKTLRELRGVLKPGGRLAVVTPEAQFGKWSDPIYHVTEYMHSELLSQLSACGFNPIADGRIGEPYRDLIVVAERVEHPAARD